MARLTERLEAIKSQGEQARIQEQGLSLAYQQTSQQVEELETLWKLQEEELNRLSDGDWQADKENAKSVLLLLPVISKIWKLRLKRLSLTKMPSKNAIKICRKR